MFMRIAGFVMGQLRKLGRPLLIVVLIVGTFVVVHTAQAIQAGQRVGPGPDPEPIYSRQPYNPGFGGTPDAEPEVSDEEKKEVQLALRFTTAWLNTSGGKAAWLSRMSPITAPEFLDGLATTDIGRVPKGTVLGSVSVTPTKRSDAWVRVGTTAGDFLVLVARRNMSDEWWINSIVRASS